MIRADRAPVLDDPSSPLPPAVVLSAGEVVKILGPAGEAHWKGDRPGEHFERDGALLRAVLSPGAAPRLVFAADVGGEVKVPKAADLCAHLSGAGLDLRTCASDLRRIVLPDGGIAAWAPCTEGRCPIVLLRLTNASEIKVTGIAGVTEARVVRGKKRSVLLVLARAARENGNLTQAVWNILPLTNGPLFVEREVPVEEIDARDLTHVKSTLLEMELIEGVMHLIGERSVKNADGTVLSSEKVHDKVDLLLGEPGDP